MNRSMFREALDLTIRACDRLIEALGDEASGPSAESATPDDDASILIEEGEGGLFVATMPAVPGLFVAKRSREDAEKAVLPTLVSLFRAERGRAVALELIRDGQASLMKARGRERAELEDELESAKAELEAALALTPYDHICRADALLHAAYDTPCEPGDETWHKQQAHGLTHDAAAHLSPRADARAAVREEAEDRKRALVIEGLERASKLVGGAAWRHEGDDAHSQGMDAGARHQVGECVKAIDAEIASLRATSAQAPQEPPR